MRRTIKAATAANSREMEIISEDLTRVFHTDEHCVAMLVNEMPVWLSPRVCFEVVDALCGYKRELARVMALNLIDFWQGFGRRLTGIVHVDKQLLELYEAIRECAIENGAKLEFKF